MIFIVNMITLPICLYINIPPFIIYYSFLILSIVFGALQAICLASVIWRLGGLFDGKITIFIMFLGCYYLEESPNKYQPYLLYSGLLLYIKIMVNWDVFLLKLLYIW